MTCQLAAFSVLLLLQLLGSPPAVLAELDAARPLRGSHVNVNTAAALRRALQGGAEHIIISAHLDLTDGDEAPAVELLGPDAGLLRSIQARHLSNQIALANLACT